MVLVAILAAALTLAPVKPCPCPESNGTKAGAEPLAFIPAHGTSPGLVVCGFRERSKAEVIKACEFEVFLCGTDQSLLQFDPFQTAYIEPKLNNLVITEISSAPFGKNWQWIDVPLRQYVITPENNPQVTKYFLLAPPILNSQQISGAIKLYRKALVMPPRDKGYEKMVIEVAGRLTAVALIGNIEAQKALKERKLLHDNSHLGEIWEQFVDLYLTYVKETGKVPTVR